VHSSLFRLDTVPPRLRAVSFRRLVFQVSEPARVRVVADGRVTVRSVRAGVFSVAHVGRPRRVIASATDAAGNVSRTIRFP
jgi:hypothetical protein